MKSKILTLAFTLLSVIAFSQIQDTIKIPIILDPLTVNGEYVSTTTGRIPTGHPVIIKIRILVDVPKDTVRINPNPFRKL